MGLNMDIGSVALHCYNSVDTVPTNISGIIINFADQAVNFFNSWTGLGIGTAVIISAYQPSVIALTMATLTKNLQIQNGGIESASIEGLSTTRSYGKMSDMWTKIAMEHLKSIGKGARYYKVLD